MVISTKKCDDLIHRLEEKAETQSQEVAEVLHEAAEVIEDLKDQPEEQKKRDLQIVEEEARDHPFASHETKHAYEEIRQHIRTGHSANHCFRNETPFTD